MHELYQRLDSDKVPAVQIHFLEAAVFLNCCHKGQYNLRSGLLGNIPKYVCPNTYVYPMCYSVYAQRVTACMLSVLQRVC